jgi:single-stranded-DNA-specific exonuclease
MARSVGIDLIVTDHHQPEGELPDALAVINPKCQDPTYVGAEACGAAVAFKLAWALTGEQRDLDLVALGTVADVVPLLGENRDLVAAGLQEASVHPRLGLAKLAEKAGIRMDALRADHIAFQLAPRINAAGRLGNGLDGLELLFSDSPEDAARLASELDKANLERRSIETAIYREVMAMLESGFHPDQRTIVLASRTWHPGVIGIVASRVQSGYYRPVILIAIDEDGRGRGSGRSIHGFNMADALAACKDHLVKFGGHAAAAGLTVLEQDIEAFRGTFEAEAENWLPPGEEIQRTLEIDAQVAFSEIDSRLLRILGRLRPFGHGNPSPVLCTYGVEPMPRSWRELRGGHLRVALKEGPTLLTAIGFHMADRIPQLEHAAALDVAFTPQFNTWRGETTIQLVLKDLRLA